MKLLPTWSTIAMLSFGVAACGATNKDPTRPSSNVSVTGGTPAATERQSEDYADGDGDVSHKDDVKILDYGHPANAEDLRKVAALFKRYYAAAVALDGTTACSLISSHLVKRLLSGYGQPLDRPPRRGESCARVTSKLFMARRYLLAIEVAKIKFTGARVAGEKGYVLLRYETLTPETLYMPIHMESGVWKIESLFGLALL